MLNFITQNLAFLLIINFNKQLSINLGVSKMVQYLQLISFANIRLPIDIWKPTSKNNSPQVNWQKQASLTYSHTKGWQAKLSVYHKAINHLYRLGLEEAEEEESDDIFNGLRSGRGVASGVEITGAYQQKKYGINVSYTLSETKDRFEKAREKDWSRGIFDHRHQVQCLAYYKPISALSIGLNYAFKSAGPALDIVALDRLGDLEAEEEWEDAQVKQVPFSRLDINVHYQMKRKSFTHQFSIGVHNLLNTENIAYYRLDEFSERFKPVYGMPLRPSFSYTFRF